jgi:hypothetical protein
MEAELLGQPRELWTIPVLGVKRFVCKGRHKVLKILRRHMGLNATWHRIGLELIKLGEKKNSETQVKSGLI